MPTAAFLIYSGTMPLLKVYATIFFGFLLAKKNLFPPAAARGASQISMNLSLPCLIFANVVPAFTPSNISAIGPLMLLAYTYQAIGFALGFLIREMFYVPRNFWQGIIILTAMSNWGNLPTTVVMSVTQQAPFDPSKDPTLGVSFVSVFIVSYHITFWAFGAARSLSWDYQPGIPQKGAAERRVSWSRKPIGGWVHRVLLHHQVEDVWPTTNEVEEITDMEKAIDSPTPVGSPLSLDSEIASPTAQTTITEVSRQLSRVSRSPSTSEKEPVPSDAEFVSARRTELIQRLLRPLRAAANSITITLVLSLVVAVVKDLKALFVDASAQGGPSWHGPDGRPPLAFVIDTASFIGGISIPLSLILLGASFARLRIPRPLSRLPFAAMFAVAGAKMVLLPVFGVLLVQAFTRGGLMHREALAERFVAMFLSGTPAAVNQLIVASLYSPDGEVEVLSAFLLVQYVLMFITSAALTAVSLALL